MFKIVIKIKNYFIRKAYLNLSRKCKADPQIARDYKRINKVLRVLKVKMKRILLTPLKIYKIQNNKVVFICYEGRSYTCNPKCISEELHNMYGDKVDIVWVFTDESKFMAIDHKYFRWVKIKTWKYYKELMTARVVLSNMRLMEEVPFRSGQDTISTGHGGGAYKHLLLDVKGISRSDKEMIKMSTKNTTLFVSTNKRYTECVVRGAYGYSGKVIECGMPRNDKLLAQGEKPLDKVHSWYNLDKDKKIVLYAPTYRRGRKLKNHALDPQYLIRTLEEKFGGEWILLNRAHHFIGYKSDESETEISEVIDATEYPDMQELLLESDVLITDYSSSVWDYSLLHKPGFLYAPDISAYERFQGFYTNIDEWPFYLAENNIELKDVIMNYDKEDHESRINKHFEDLGSTETGEATKILTKLIIDLIERR